MATPQHKIGSGFGATTTAAEVIAGVDLRGRLAIVTGGYSGIGLETTRVLTGAGAHVVVPARRPDQARAAVGAGVEVAELDLGDLDSVRDFAARFLDSGRRIDLMVNSAGIMAAPESRVGPGWEAQFATNHLGHFALVGRLWPAVGPGARIVSVSSRGHHFSGIRWDDVHFTRDAYDKWLAYGQAKTANVLFAVHLDDADRGIRAFSLHPGRIHTNLVRYLEREELVAAGMFTEAGEIIGDVKTVEQGAATQVWAATAERLAGLGGVYLDDCDVAEPAPADGTRVGVRDYAVDPAQAARLWTLSAELTGVDPLA
ncbi:MAG TPA: SDR family NAD(P)-dependent oxidoreductase [Actinophytocola sp.]|jgi:NAD(P)-dependent dehydrogenase (short-subunit alcohol dehydrogenase family)|nr:SDR family NAD(P)-dependent oxidoreductase [Actinophytocola sp.]